ncbi:MAG: LapA family protein [Chloroflexota bacterium]|nr:LapA family protein [Chloroflexota bacterium]
MTVAALLTILAFVLGILLTIFVVQNTDQVRLDFLGYSTGNAPLAAVILLSALVGAALASVLWLRERIRHALDVRRRDKRLRELEAEVSQLRAGSRTTSQETTTTDYTPGSLPQ